MPEWLCLFKINTQRTPAFQKCLTTLLIIIFLDQKHKYNDALRYKNLINYPTNIRKEENGDINLICTLHSLQYDKSKRYF